MIRDKKLGLAGLVLVGGLALGVSGCYRPPIELPNHYETTGEIRKSDAHKGSYNILSREADLEEKSRVTGEITYIGFAKNENSVSVNNINQNSSSSGLISGNTENNVEIFNNSGVIIKIKTDEKNYIFNLKSYNNILPPSMVLENFKAGDKISIPTIRKYDYIFYTGPGYRILNGIDYLYLEEIQSLNEK